MKINEIDSSLEDIINDMLIFSKNISTYIDLLDKLSHNIDEQVLIFCREQLNYLLNIIQNEPETKIQKDRLNRVKTILFFVNEELNRSERLE